MLGHLKYYSYVYNVIMRDMKDLFNTKCKECKGGKYVETSMQDDWRGVLHCNNCNDEVKRYFKTSSKL